MMPWNQNNQENYQSEYMSIVICLMQIMIDTYEAGIKDQLFNAIYEVNKETHIAVSTREIVRLIVLHRYT